MKKTLAFILALCLCLGMCACGGESESTEATQSSEAQKADALIMAIGDVTLDSEQAILDAEAYYNNLSDKQKSEVENYAVLTAARDSFDHLQNEAITQEAIAEYNKGNYDKALALFRDVEQTDDVRSGIKMSGSMVLSDFIFLNGKRGNFLGVYGASLEADGYYYEKDGLILFVKTSGSSYEYLQFTTIEEISNYGTLRFCTAKVSPLESTFSYERFFSVPLNYSHNAVIEQGTYKADTYVDYKLSYISARPNFSETREEINKSVSDTCNELLNKVATYLEKNNVGVTLYDLGFFSYGIGRPAQAPEELISDVPSEESYTTEEIYQQAMGMLQSDSNAAYSLLLECSEYGDSAELLKHFLPVGMQDQVTGEYAMKYYYEYNETGNLAKITVENTQYEIGNVVFELDENMYPVVAHREEDKFCEAYDIAFELKTDNSGTVTEIVATYTVKYKNGSVQNCTDTYMVADGKYITTAIESYMYTVSTNSNAGKVSTTKTEYPYDSEAVDIHSRHPIPETPAYIMSYDMHYNENGVGYADIPFLTLYLTYYANYYDLYDYTFVK